jgi:hypothetical protein
VQQVENGSCRESGEHVVIDVDVDAMVREIGALVREATVDLALRVGQLIVNRFFEGDALGWREREHRSFRKLAQHPELPMSASALRRCVGLYELTQRIGDLSRYDRLGTSHFRAILGLGQDEQRQLLEAANSEGWTVTALELRAAEVRAANPARGGRPRVPPLVKLMRRLGPLADEAAQQLAQIEHAAPSDLDQRELQALFTSTTTLLESLRRRLSRPVPPR